MVEFSEPIQTASADQVTVSAAGMPLDVIRSLSNGNRTLVLSPLIPLEAQITHNIDVGNGVKDLSGNPLLSAVGTTFTTGSGADLIRPTRTTTDPANGAVNVPTNVVVRVGFSERINPLTVNGSTFFVQDVNVFGVHVPGTIAVASDGRSASFLPAQGLALSTRYTVTTSGITDLTGQSVTFLSTSFTTGLGADAEGPVVVAVSPPDGTTGVPVNARIVVQLNEPVSAVSVTGEAVRVSAGGAPVAGAVSVSSDSRTLTFTPTTLLATSTLYTVQVGGFTDLAGNAVVPFTSSFTTSASATADATRPSVASISPANAATNVDVNTAIVWTFNEVIDPSTVNSGSMPVTI
ncbi:MAG: Ig-like domain-containing protein, partial [bacterium]